MSTLEHVFVKTDLAPEEVAERLAELLNMSVTRDESGKVFLSRPASEGRPGEVGGEVYRNRYSYPFDEPEEASVIDGYGVVLDAGYTRRDSDVQRAEARELFEELAEKAPWPAVLLGGLDLLLAASSPGRGLRWFPPGTTPDAEHRLLWEPYR